LYPVLGSPYVQNESLSTYFTVYDAYGDDYTFYVNQNSTNGSLKQIPINIRIPLLYSDDFSIGFGNIQRYFESNIFGETGFPSENIFIGNGGGIYLTVGENPFWLTGVLGIIYYEINSKVDEIRPSFYGDPGLYWNGNFYSPGTPLIVTGRTGPRFCAGLGCKYYLFNGLFLEANCYYFPGGVIEDMKYILQGPQDLEIVVDPSQKPKPITIKESFSLNFGVGIGL